MLSPAARPDNAPAFGLLDVIRRFVRQRLEDADETLSRREGYLLGVLNQAAAQHGSRDCARRLLDSEQPNLLLVMRWTIDGHRPSGQLLQRIDDGRYPEAAALLDEMLPDARRLEEPARRGLALMLRGLSRPYAENSPARAEFEEALAVARRAGDPELAGPHLTLAARHYIRIDHRDGQSRCLGALSALALALARGHVHHAARLIGAAAAARAIGLGPWLPVAEAGRRTIERVRAALPSGEFTAAETEGQSQTSQTALAPFLDLPPS